MVKNKAFFPTRPDFKPTIYAYEENNPDYKGMLKIGYTGKDVEERVKDQYPTKRPGRKPYTVVFSEPALREDGTYFKDTDIHRYMRKKGFKNPDRSEWFKCTVEDLKSAYIAIKNRIDNEESRTADFPMRKEQEEAVLVTQGYYEKEKKESPDKVPQFLWNCKMRFGKTFAAYQLAKQMGFKRILVLTFKPAVQSAWEDDLSQHVDFDGWQFLPVKARTSSEEYDAFDKAKPIVCFGSFQDILGKNSAGGIKAKNEWVHTTHWDIIIFDEYHFGAWRENAKELFESDDDNEVKQAMKSGLERINEVIEDSDNMPITTDHFLYLSGTPFRAIATGEFIENQIYNWTYSKEQQAKEDEAHEGKTKIYAPLPRMVMLTYQLPKYIIDVATDTEFNEFDLNEFFKAEGDTTENKDAVFKHQNEVQKWLDLIRGSAMETTTDNLKLGAKKPVLPYSDTTLLEVLNHTIWFLPNVNSCHAMKNLLSKKHNTFYHDYHIHVCAGKSAGIGLEALEKLRPHMDDPLKSKTITLTCGKLTTGVTVPPWTGIFMLRTLSTPETYFQSAFRVQSPWTVEDETVKSKQLILKEECYVFDFAPERALRQIADYACRLNTDDVSPEKKVDEFINFLPVIAYDGSTMRKIDAAGILDIATSGTTATLLARRWESALLVNVDNNTLKIILENPRALEALSNIEGFRSLNKDIETIINKSGVVKNLKNKANDKDLTKKEKKQLTEAEKEMNKGRKFIQQKLIKFATRIPVFMYLTDYREETLKDVIRQLEPDLFRAVTGLTLPDFELLISIGVFNDSLMNDAIFKFRKYEDSSLVYTGINKNAGEKIGGWDTTVKRDELYFH